MAEGYQAGTAAIKPETVTVSGSVEQVSQVARVVAMLRGQENLESQFAGDLPLTLLDRGKPAPHRPGGHPLRRIGLCGAARVVRKGRWTLR